MSGCCPRQVLTQLGWFWECTRSVPLISEESSPAATQLQPPRKQQVKEAGWSHRWSVRFMSALSRQNNESSSREDPQLESGLCISSSGLS